MVIDLKSFACGAVLCGLFAGGYGLAAQTRFGLGKFEPVDTVQGLSIVNVHDAVMNTCYALFLLEPPRTVAGGQLDQGALADAARERDRLLAGLSAEYEQGIPGGVPATAGTNPLKYQWEAANIQSGYEHLLRESEMTRLERQLDRIAGAQRLAAAVPVPCDK
jgi:hypothetical protein